MRTKVWKDALYLGRWITPEGGVFDCGPEDMKHFFGRAKAMLAHGTPIPWCVEHKKGVGLSREEQIDAWAKSIKGHVHDARMNSAGEMEIELDVDDADKPLLEALKSVSPEIRFNVRDRNGPAKDDTGPYWPGGSIAHIAVTGVPVQFPQRPFNFGSAVSLSQCGVTVSLSAATFAPSTSLSMADKPKFPPDDKPGAETPPAPGGDGKPPEGGDAPPDNPDIDDIESEETPTPLPGAPPGKGGDDPAGDTALIMTLGQIIAPLGIEVHVQPGMTIRDYVSHLCTAGKTHVATKDLSEVDDPANDPNNPNNAPQPNANEPLPEVSETAPVMMSAAMSNTLQAENTALKARLGKAIQNETKSVRDRLAAHALIGHISADHANGLVAKLRTVSLSAVSSPAMDAVVAELAVIDRLVKDGHLKPAFRNETSVSLSQRGGEIETISDAVESRKGDVKRQEDAGDELAALCGVPVKKSA